MNWTGGRQKRHFQPQFPIQNQRKRIKNDIKQMPSSAMMNYPNTGNINWDFLMFAQPNRQTESEEGDGDSRPSITNEKNVSSSQHELFSNILPSEISQLKEMTGYSTPPANVHENDGDGGSLLSKMTQNNFLTFEPNNSVDFSSSTNEKIEKDSRHISSCLERRVTNLELSVSKILQILKELKNHSKAKEKLSIFQHHSQ